MPEYSIPSDIELCSTLMEIRTNSYMRYLFGAAHERYEDDRERELTEQAQGITPVERSMPEPDKSLISEMLYGMRLTGSAADALMDDLDCPQKIREIDIMKMSEWERRRSREE